MEDRKIRFGAMVWHEVHEKVNTLPLTYLLNSEVNLSHYGKGLKTIYFTFMVPFPQASHGYKDSFRYTTANETLSAFQKMDYNAVYLASETEALRLMGECFLETMQKLRQRKLPDFDTETFLTDLKQLLDKEYLVKLVA